MLNFMKVHNNIIRIIYKRVLMSKNIITFMEF